MRWLLALGLVGGCAGMGSALELAGDVTSAVASEVSYRRSIPSCFDETVGDRTVQRCSPTSKACEHERLATNRQRPGNEVSACYAGAP